MYSKVEQQFKFPEPKDYADDIFKIVSNPLMQKIYKIYDLVSSYIREFLNKEGFQEYKAVIIGPVTDPGIRGAKQVSIDYYGREYKIMSSAILYKQLLSIANKSAGGSGKIYFFADNIRLEPLETASTDRHLAEFIQVDLEIFGADHHEAMNVAERLLSYVIERVKSREELKEIWNYFEPYRLSRGLKSRKSLKEFNPPFKRYTHKEAVDFLADYLSSHKEILDEMKKLFGYKPKELSYSSEIPWEYEWLMSYLHSEPFFIHDYPRGSRGFYDREYPDKLGLLMDFDLLYPEGYGEAASGAAREYELSKVVQRMKETGEKLEKYAWYLDFLKKYSAPTAGFGIGLERLVRYICGLPSIYLSIPTPKIPGVYSP
ncbi:MAG TPA: asparagine synthetase A [Geobacterales bacterium]|nr:asparagine synthetase A [Geobacterales bacterium]